MLTIKNFSISKLYGVFDYAKADEAFAPELVIFYGDNGCGKTTVLTLIYHLLSCTPQRGHLTAISKIKFENLSVTLSDGTVVSAQRPRGVDDTSLIFRVKRRRNSVVEFSFSAGDEKRDTGSISTWDKYLLPTSSDQVPFPTGLLSPFETLGRLSSFSSATDLHAYYDALKGLEISCYFMGTDRQLKSDVLEREAVPSARRPVDLESDGDVIARARTQYLRAALRASTDFVVKKLIGASLASSKNTNDIYTDIIREVSTDENTVVDDPRKVLEHAIKELASLNLRQKRFVKLGIAPSLNVTALVNAIRTSSPKNAQVLHRILRPYVESLAANMAALRPIGDTIETFLRILNDFFKFKSIDFTQGSGFQIKDPTGEPIEVGYLSSGEQQLLLLFCHLLTSNASDSVFFIDEPEISLNIKWQRDLIQAMLEVTKTSGNQLVIATHSIELLSQYSDRVFELQPSVVGRN